MRAMKRSGLSGTPAEAGVQESRFDFLGSIGSRLSGTPAEAGVQGERRRIISRRDKVSVEPPPKRGCKEVEEALCRLC